MPRSITGTPAPPPSREHRGEFVYTPAEGIPRQITDLQQIRIAALEIAVRAAPFLYPPQSTAAEKVQTLFKDAEIIARWIETGKQEGNSGS